MGYTALYRQYRPLVFDKVIGQRHITVTLKNQVTANRIAHAYLFAGTRGTGKTSTARILSRAVNCLDPKGGNPCNRCPICERALASKLMDIIEIDAASNRGVDEIRDLREKVKFPPAEGKYRVYIVDEVHMLTAEAFNALLKTLEEPPAHIIFILATTEPHRLPATVLSRCQRFDFKRIAVAEIVELLKEVAQGAGINIDDEALEHIAGRVDGSARDALSLLDKCFTFSDEPLTLDWVVSVLGMANEELLFGLTEELARDNAAGCIALLNKSMQDGRDTGRLFKDIIYYLRDILIIKAIPTGSSGISEKKRADLLAVADKTEINTLIRWINTLAEAEAKAKWSTYPGVFLEVALVKLCEPSMDASFEGLKDRLARLEGIVASHAQASYREKPMEDTGEKGLDAPGPGANKDIKEPEERDGDKKEPGRDRDARDGGKGRKGTTKEDSADEVKGEKRDSSVDTKSDFNKEERTDSGIKEKPGYNAGELLGDNTEDKPNTDPETDQQLSLEAIIKDWDAVLKHLERTKKGLYTIIKNSKPVRTKGRMLTIKCDALKGIYQEIANRKENKGALEDAVLTVTGARFDVKIEDTGTEEEDFESYSEGNYNLYEETVKIFGEDLVERLEDEDY